MAHYKNVHNRESLQYSNNHIRLQRNEIAFFCFENAKLKRCAFD